MRKINEKGSSSVITWHPSFIVPLILPTPAPEEKPDGSKASCEIFQTELAVIFN